MLQRLISPKPKTPPDEIAGVRVKANMRARRLSLRADPKTGDVVLIWPRRASLTAAARFIEEQKPWIERQRAHMVRPEVFTPGMQIAVNGENYTLRHIPGRGTTRIDNGEIIVHGMPEHFHRRLRDFLKAEALRRLQALTTEKTNALDIKPSVVRVVDPQTRWGSCGSDGRIMYSWRLILAPVPVMDYIVAHEVAHRIHMNHSKNFWRLCLSLTENGAASRRWLKKEGHSLMRYA